jgi:hypothetical protein
MTYLGLEDTGEHQQKDTVQKINNTNRNVEVVGTLVHPWAHLDDGNQVNKLDEEQCKGLDSSRLLSESNEHRLHQKVQQERDDKVIGRCTELHIQETPPVQCSGVRVQDVCGVLVESNGAACNVNDLPCSVSQNSNNRNEKADGEGHGTS